MNNRLVAMLAVAFVVAACSRGEQAETPANAPAARAPAVAGAEVVAAVLQSPGRTVAKLGFVVLARPVIGVQSGLRLDVTAQTEVAALLLLAEADGLALDPVTARASLSLVAGASVASHELRFTPQRAGLTEVTVRLRSDETDSTETVYLIPVLVDEPAAGG